MADIPEEKRHAYFKTVLCLIDPEDQSTFLSEGRTDGMIKKEAVADRHAGFGYDPIFFVEQEGKTYAEMDVAEKNAVSHRGKALVKMEYYLKRTYGAKQFIVPYALVIKKGSSYGAAQRSASSKIS